MFFASGQTSVNKLTLLLGTTYSWFPEKIDLLNGMTLGAGLGAGAAGLLGLILTLLDRNVNLEIFVIGGTIAGIIFGAAAVAAGNANIHLI